MTPAINSDIIYRKQNDINSPCVKGNQSFFTNFLGDRLYFVQVLTAQQYLSGRLFGRNRHGPKSGGCAPF